MRSVSFVGFLAPGLLGLAVPGAIRAADCNGNGIDDLEDIRSASLTFEPVPVTPLSGSVRDIAAVDFDGDGHEDSVDFLQ